MDSDSQIFNALRDKLKQSPTVIAKFKEYDVPIDELDFIPMHFVDNLGVSARTQHGVISFNSELRNKVDDLPHYGSHEINHYLQQTTGDQPTQGSADDSYLDNPYEIEGFQTQTKFIEENDGVEKAEQYVDKVLDHHDMDGRERANKKKELLAHKKPRQLSLFPKIKDERSVPPEEVEQWFKDFDEGKIQPKGRKHRIEPHRLSAPEQEFRMQKLKEILDAIESKKAFVKEAGVLKAPVHVVQEFASWVQGYFCQMVADKIEIKSVVKTLIHQQNKKLEQYARSPEFQMVLNKNVDGIIQYLKQNGSFLFSIYQNVDNQTFGSKAFGRPKGQITDENYIKIIHLPEHDIYESIIGYQVDYFHEGDEQDLRYQLSSYFKSDLQLIQPFLEFINLNDNVVETNLVIKECNKYINSESRSKEKTIILNNDDIEYLKDKTDIEFKIYGEIIDDPTQMKEKFSEDWTGLWSPIPQLGGLLSIYINPTWVGESSQNLNSLNYYLQKLYEAVRHETQHAVQSSLMMALQKNEPFYTSGIPFPIRKKEYKKKKQYFSEQEHNGSALQGEEHVARDVEFYTNLNDRIDEFQYKATKYPPEVVKLMLNKCIKFEKVEFEDLIPLLKESNHSEIKRTQIELNESFKYIINFFKKLSHHSQEKYHKAVREFYKQISPLVAQSGAQQLFLKILR